LPEEYIETLKIKSTDQQQDRRKLHYSTDCQRSNYFPDAPLARNYFPGLDNYFL